VTDQTNKRSGFVAHNAWGPTGRGWAMVPVDDDLALVGAWEGRRGCMDREAEPGEVDSIWKDRGLRPDDVNDEGCFGATSSPSLER
jgi:hypothetical protein